MAEIKNKYRVTVGSIFAEDYNTGINFYQVTKITSGGCYARRINGKIIHDGSLRGGNRRIMPDYNSWVGKSGEKYYRVMQETGSGHIYIVVSPGYAPYGRAYLWRGGSAVVTDSQFW